MKRFSSALLFVGMAMTAYGVATPVVNFVLARTWAMLVLFGMCLSTLGVVLAVLEDGVAALLPRSLRHCLFESPFEIGMHTRLALRNLKIPTGAMREGENGFSQFARVAFLCCMDLEDDLVEDVVASLEDDFRDATFQPCARSLHPVVRRLVLGREGVHKLQQMQAVRMSRPPTTPGSPCPSEASTASVRRRRNTKAIAKEIHELHNASDEAAAEVPQRGSRRATKGAADRRLSDTELSPMSRATKSSRGSSRSASENQTRRDLALVWRILCGHFMVPALRRLHARARASGVWRLILWCFELLANSWVGAMFEWSWPVVRRVSGKLVGGL